MWISCILKNMFFFTWIWTAKTQQNALWKLPIEFWAKKHKLCHAEGFYETPPLIELCARLLALAMLLASWHLGLIHSNLKPTATSNGSPSKNRMTSASLIIAYLQSTSKII